MKVFIPGLGLIGGSFAKAIKHSTQHTVIGYDLDQQVLDQALHCGAIDGIGQQVPQDTNLLVLALYPAAAVDYISRHIDEIPTNCTVIDLCGVKRYICDAVGPTLRERGILFIGGHPMSGREYSGFSGSDPALFQGASMILTPTEPISAQLQAEIEAFFYTIGFGRITYTTPAHHDEMIALTSQLAHVVSSAYVQNPAANQYMGFTGGSFQDMTRVANLHAGMWTELFLLNRDYLEDQIGHMVAKLEEFKTAISQGDSARLLQMLQDGALTKQRLEQARKEDASGQPQKTV